MNLKKEKITKRLVLRKNRNESYKHIIIKLLAFLHNLNQDLMIEPNYRFKGYKPDLLRLDPPLNPKQIEPEIGLWIECKTVKLQKLDDLVRYSTAKIIWYHDLQYFKRLNFKQLKKYKRLTEIHMIGINADYSFIANSLRGGNPTWEFLELADNHYELYADGIMLSKIDFVELQLDDS